MFALLVFGLLALTGTAWATPLRPDLQKILKQSGRRLMHFEPARAGWDGPEVSQSSAPSPGQLDLPYGPAAADRSIRAALLAAAIPDPKAVIAIGGLIILLRLLRQQKHRRTEVVPVVATTPSGEEKAA